MFTKKYALIMMMIVCGRVFGYPAHTTLESDALYRSNSTHIDALIEAISKLRLSNPNFEGGMNTLIDFNAKKVFVGIDQKEIANAKEIIINSIKCGERTLGKDERGVSPTPFQDQAHFERIKHNLMMLIAQNWVYSWLSNHQERELQEDIYTMLIKTNSQCITIYTQANIYDILPHEWKKELQTRGEPYNHLTYRSQQSPSVQLQYIIDWLKPVRGQYRYLYNS